MTYNVILIIFLKNIKFDFLLLNGDIYPIPGKYIYMYSQYIIDGIEEIAKIIYKIEIET